MLNVSKPEFTTAVATATTWEKPARSGPISDNCAEFADLGNGMVAFRDSKNPNGPVIVLNRGEMAALIGSAVDGQFNRFLA